MPEFKRKEIFEMEYGDFDTFVEEKLGKEYECVLDNEWSNYESHDFDITEKDISEDPESFFQKYTVRDVEAWLAGTKSSIDASSLLEYMAYKSIIPYGNYLITIFW